MLSGFRRTMKRNGGTLLAITVVLAMTIGTMAGCGKDDNMAVLSGEEMSDQRAGEGIISILNMIEVDDSAADFSLPAGSGRKTSTVLTVMKEGMPEEMPATLYVGEGYSLYVTDGDWDNFEPNEWQVEKNNQVHFCVGNYEGLNKSQVESNLLEQVYVVENDELCMQENEIIYRTICYETESNVWTVTFICPWGEAEEGWLPVMRAMADTFTVETGYDVGTYTENALMP